MKSEAVKGATPPDFHDGSLTGIVLGDSTVDLLCSTVDGARYRWRLFGLRRLRADNFLQGNLIFEVNIYEHEVPSDLVMKAFREENVHDAAWLPAELARLRGGKGVLLEVTSSYGCELVAVADGGFVMERLAE